jgi:hypothetical protein
VTTSVVTINSDAGMLSSCVPIADLKVSGRSCLCYEKRAQRSRAVWMRNMPTSTSRSRT